jgi:hypothetical protein
MGQSTDAILFYGYHLPEDYVPNEEATELYKKEEPVLVGKHCSGDCPMYYVYIVESQTRAWRGNAQPIDPDQLREMDMRGGAKWNGQLFDFAERYALPNPGEEVGEYLGSASTMGWWLVSYWG